MGTNYYLHRNTCEHCGRSDERIHIGKSSYGWCFSLHRIPGEIESLNEWISAWDTGTIRNEDGESITPEQMLDTITNRHGQPWDDYEYGDGRFLYSSEADMHRSNHSQRGPNSLLRHNLGGWCVGHGEGTWDLIDGDFS